MNTTNNITEALCELKTTSSDEDGCLKLTALLYSSIHDKKPAYTTSEILDGILKSETASFLDPLHVVPLLLEVDGSDAGDILNLVAENGNAKENIIASQEGLERYIHKLSSEEVESAKAFLTLQRLLLIYESSVPRIQLRRRSPTDTVKPFIRNLSTALEIAASYLSSEESRQIMTYVSNLLSKIQTWTAAWENGSDILKFKAEAKTVFLSALGDLESRLQLRFAEKQFTRAFPRLASIGTRRGDTSKNDEMIDILWKTARELSIDIDVAIQERSTGALVMIALLLQLSPTSTVKRASTLTDLFPVIVSSLQSTSGADASISILLYYLHPPEGHIPEDVDPELIPPLVHSLIPISCGSPNPKTRHIAFRTLGILVSRSPPLEKMTILRDLLTDETYPALRVASVGLLKDATLLALANLPTPDLFASPQLLRTFGYIVLRPRPADLFVKMQTAESFKEFLETDEPKRVVECLSFYYILLRRDIKNMTGVHDASQVKSTKKEFVEPLQTVLQRWGEISVGASDHHVLMMVAAMETSLERLDEALKETGHVD